MPTLSHPNDSMPTPVRLNSPVPTILPSLCPYQSPTPVLNYLNGRIVIPPPPPPLPNSPVTLTSPLVFLHHAPTVPLTSSNTLSLSVTCPISSVPTPTYPIISKPTIPPTGCLHQLPTSTAQSVCLHDHPTASPTSSNVQPFSATCLTNSMPTGSPTSSNAQPFVPTYPDKTLPTTALTYSSMPTVPFMDHLHQAPTEPPTSSNILTLLRLRTNLLMMLRYPN